MSATTIISHQNHKTEFSHKTDFNQQIPTFSGTLIGTFNHRILILISHIHTLKLTKIYFQVLTSTSYFEVFYLAILMYVTIIKKSEFESNRKHSIQKSYILFTYHLGQGPTMIISTKKKDILLYCYQCSYSLLSQKHKVNLHIPIQP